MKRWVVALGVLALAACDRGPEVADPGAECLTASTSEAAIEACTAMINDEARSDTQRSIGHTYRGRAHEKSGDVTAALRDYEAALRLHGDNPNALLWRAEILIESGQLDAAEPLLRRAIEVHDSGRAKEMMGRIALLRGDYPAAIEYFSVRGSSATALAGRARAKQRTGDLAGAADDYDAAIRADGALAEARAGRCWLDLNENRNLDRARGDAAAAVVADERNVEGQLCRGVLQLRDGEWANARASFEAVLAIEPGNPTALFGRGVARRRSGDNAGREDMNLARDFDRHIGESYDEMGVETY